MIARYIYTDCASDGPYAKGTGYKYKSVAFVNGFDNGGATVQSIQELLPKNSLAAGYQVPEAPDSLTSVEFENLPKSWAFAKTSDFGYSLQRMATAGLAYGRPTKFFEGFTFSEDAWPKLAETCAEQTKPMRLRPVDFVNATGWLNPRGEAELESTQVTGEFYRISPEFKEQLKADLATVRSLPNIKALTTAFAQAQLHKNSFAVPTGNRSQFFAIVSVFTRLIPQALAWRTGFSDSWSAPRDKQLADGNNPHFILADLEVNITSTAAAWGELATEALGSGMVGKIIKKIDDLDIRQTEPKAALTVLADAILKSDAEDLASRPRLAELARNLVNNGGLQ